MGACGCHNHSKICHSCHLPTFLYLFSLPTLPLALLTHFHIYTSWHKIDAFLKKASKINCHLLYQVTCVKANSYVTRFDKSHLPRTIVTVSAKTILISTFSITRKTNLKYSSCCGCVVLDFSHARFTVRITRVVI